MEVTMKVCKNWNLKQDQEIRKKKLVTLKKIVAKLNTTKTN